MKEYAYFCCIAGWSSLVARRAHNPKVAGSNPAPATNAKDPHAFHCGSFLLLRIWSLIHLVADLRNPAALTEEIVRC